MSSDLHFKRVVATGAFRTLRFNKAFNVDKSRNHKRLPLQQWHWSRQFVRMPERLLKAFLLLTVALVQLSQAQPGEGGDTPPPPAPPQLQVASTIWKLPHSNSNFPRKNYSDWYSLICIECKPHDCFTLMCISDNYFLRLTIARDWYFFILSVTIVHLFLGRSHLVSELIFSSKFGILLMMIQVDFFTGTPQCQYQKENCPLLNQYLTSIENMNQRILFKTNF